MNLRELQYLVAVDEERHFHRAAEACYVSQPTLSGQLKKLEQELGVLLVERNNRQVAMTEAGRKLADQARLVLAGVQDLREMARYYQDPMAGTLQLGIIPTLAPYLLPVIMPALNRHYPELKFWLYEYQTRVLLEKLRRSELDVLLLALPIEAHDFSVIDLFREPLRLAIHSKALLAKQKMVTLGDIAKQEMLLLEEGHCLRSHVQQACLKANVTEKREFRATSLETLRHMVGEGMGMTLIPELAVPHKLTKTDSVHYIEFSDPKPNRQIAMLYRKNSYREQVFYDISEQIKTVLPATIFF